MRRQRVEEAATGEFFWRFSLALYVRPGVAAALLALQDRAGHDVNLILYGLWLGAVRGQRCDTVGLDAAQAAIAPLNAAVVTPLRQLRRQLKGAAGPDLAALRRRLARLELEAERRVQYRLAMLAATASPARADGDGLAAAEANLALCLSDDAGSAEAHVLRRALRSLTRAGDGRG
jgi:uncharacterized protein (TIGR02444 family)